MIRALAELNEDETKVQLTYIDVISNNEAYTDVRGRPAHSVECIVEEAGGGSIRDDDIAQKILDSRGLGTPTYGTEGPFVTYDRKERPYNVWFSKPIPVPIYIKLILTVSELLTGDELTALKQEVVEGSSSIGIGEDVTIIGPDGLASYVTHQKIKAATMTIGKTAVPIENYIDISNGLNAAPEKAAFATTHVTINQSV